MPGKKEKKKEMVTALMNLHEIQTHKRFKRMAFIRTKDNICTSCLTKMCTNQYSTAWVAEGECKKRAHSRDNDIGQETTGTSTKTI